MKDGSRVGVERVGAQRSLKGFFASARWDERSFGALSHATIIVYAYGVGAVAQRRFKIWGSVRIGMSYIDGL